MQAAVRAALALYVSAACAPGGDAADSASAERRGAQVGAFAPALEARTLDGAPVALDSLRGAPVLLNVWATWCHPCRDEIPVLEELHRQYAPQGLRVVGVTIDNAGRTADIRSFARQYGMTYPIWHDPDQYVMPAFSVIGVPTTVLIDRAGRLVWRKTGEIKARDPMLAAAIDSTMAR